MPINKFDTTIQQGLITEAGDPQKTGESNSVKSFNSVSDLPPASQFGKGVAQVGSSLYVSDGNAYSTASTGMLKIPLQEFDDVLNIANTSLNWTHTAAAGGVVAASAVRSKPTILVNTPATAGLNSYTTAPLSAINLSAYDYIELVFYANEYDNASPNIGTLFLFTSTPGTADYYSAIISARKPGWNIVRIEKALFTTNGAPSWSNLNQVRFRVNSVAGNARNVYFAKIDAVKIGQRQPVISLCFDDGWDDSLQVAALAAARNIPVTFFVIRHLLDTAGYLKTSDLSTILSMGHEIGVHGADSGYNNWQEEVAALGYQGLLNKLAENNTYLISLGVDTEIGSYPQGYYYAASPILTGIENDDIQKAVKASGLKYVRTTQISHTTAGDYAQYSKDYPRSGLTLSGGLSLNNAATLTNITDEIALTKNKGGWLSIYGHKIGTTGDSVTWLRSDFISLLEYLASERAAGRIEVFGFGKTARNLESSGYITIEFES